MAITGIDTIEGKQIIAAGAVSAKSAEMAYNDENGNPITGYLTAVPEGYATTGDLATVSAKVAPSGIAVFQMYAPSSTYSAVTAAINAGKMVYAKDSDTYLPLTKWNSYYQILYFGSGPGGMGDGHATFTGNATMTVATLCNQHTGGDYSYGWSNSTTAIPNNSLVNNKLDKSAFSTVSSTFYTTANPSGFISEVPATYLQNTDLEISDNKVTGISGVPLAAGGGGDVPEGVMAESGLEYNAVDEISAYNGSAIAQYGAEKQWLQHDDTIVHVANSAQYAFGVNLSVIERLLGIDETVLYNNTAATTADLPIGSTFNISEPITNFNRVNIQFSRFGLNSNRPCTQSVVLDTTAAIPTILLHTTFSTTDTGDGGWYGLSMLISGTSGTTWKMAKCYQNTLPAGALDQGWCYLKPYKVIGIGRKS